MTTRARATGARCVALVSSVLLAACGSISPAANSDTPTKLSTTAATMPPVDDEPTTKLTVWSWRTEDDDAYNAIFDVFEQAHPGVSVEFVPFVASDYNNLLATGLAGRGGPDIVQLRGYGGAQPLIEAEQVIPLDGRVASLSNFSDEMLQGARGRRDGRIYGVPFGVQVVGAFYNVRLFEELGLREPTTWDEFIAVLDALDDAGYIPISTPGKDVWMFPILHDAIGSPRYGGREFLDAVLDGTTNFEDPDYVASLELLSSMEHYLPPDVVGVSYNDARTFFAAERAGIFIGGSFELGFWQSEAPDLELGVFRVPAPPGAIAPASTPGWMDGSFAVNAHSDETEAAIELVDWMGTPEFGQLFSDVAKQISPVRGVTPTDPLLDEFDDLYHESPVPYLMLVHFRYGEPLGSDLSGNGIQAMFLGTATAEDVAREIDEGLATWFTPGRRVQRFGSPPDRWPHPTASAVADRRRLLGARHPVVHTVLVHPAGPNAVVQPVPLDEYPTRRIRRS